MKLKGEATLFLIATLHGPILRLCSDVTPAGYTLVVKTTMKANAKTLTSTAKCETIEHTSHLQEDINAECQILGICDLSCAPLCFLLP